MTEYEGILKVTESEKKKVKKISFSVSYTDKKGKTHSNEPLRLDVCAFNKDTAQNGCKVIIRINDTGQIEKCYVPGDDAPEYKQVFLPGDLQITPAEEKAFSSRPAISYAAAPYNFIPYDPDAVVEAFKGETRRWCGHIRCRLTALTPLLVCGGQERPSGDEPSSCRFFEVDGKWIIPGTSIKGMLRSLVEILSFSAMRPVSDEKPLWTRKTSHTYRPLLSPLISGRLHKKGRDYIIQPVELDDPEGKLTPLPSESKYLQGERQVASSVFKFFIDHMNDEHEKRWKKQAPALTNGRGVRIFYYEENGAVCGISLGRFVRMPFRRSPAQVAKSDDNAATTDMATGLFGTVRPQASRGRVSISAAEVRGRLANENGYLVVLGEPKVTCFPHYLEQNLAAISKKGESNEADFSNYDDPRARLRGRKMYWHHVENARAFGLESENVKIASRLYPLAPGARADIDIRVDGLTDMELGCLMAAIELPGEYAHKLGMGKAMGFGSIRLNIVSLEVEDGRSRYASLANRLKALPKKEMGASERAELIELFCSGIYQALKKKNKTGNAKSYNELPSIRALNLMLNFRDKPRCESVAPQKLKQFNNNPVLPEPAWVIQLEKREKGPGQPRKT